MWFWSMLGRRFASSHSASSSRMAKRWRPIGRIIHIYKSVCHCLSNFCPIWHRLLSPNFRWYPWGQSSPSRSRTKAFLRSSVKMAAVSDALKVSATLPEGKFWTEKQIAPSLMIWHGNASIRYPDSVLVRENMKAYVSKSDDIETIQEKSRTINVGEVNTPRPLFL